MRIGIVCPYDLSADGGVQQLTRELRDRLGESGHDVILVGPATMSTGDIVSVGRTVAIRANRSRVPISVDRGALAATRRALADVDVVHVHEPLVPVVGWAGLWRAKPVVATFHADPAPWTRLLYRLFARPATSRLGTATLTAVSEVAAAALPPRWGPVEVIPNAIDASAYDVDVTRNSSRVAFLGRDDPRKGLDVLLAAWPQVRAVHPEAELIVIGATRPIADAGVRFLGRLDEADKRDALASAAVFAAPNLGGESFGLVVAEAMAAGCAVVASDIPAFRPVVGGAGRFVAPGDVFGLARAIGELLEDPVAAEARGRQARKSARRFDWTLVLGQYGLAYESALSRHRSNIGSPKE